MQVFRPGPNPAFRDRQHETISPRTHVIANVGDDLVAIACGLRCVTDEVLDRHGSRRRRVGKNKYGILPGNANPPRNV
jgi:hypothetical protein